MKKLWRSLKTMTSAALMLFGASVFVFCYYIASGFDVQAVQRLIRVLQGHVSLEQRRNEKLVEEIRAQIREARKQAIEEAKRDEAEPLHLADMRRKFQA